jgi:hypothetical protein
VVRVGDVHRNAHGWGLGDVGVVQPSGLDYERRAHGLLAAVIFQDSLLDSLLDVQAEELEPVPLAGATKAKGLAAVSSIWLVGNIIRLYFSSESKGTCFQPDVALWLSSLWRLE